MSTNTTQISKSTLNIVLLSGVLIFFATLLISPFINVSTFATEYTTFKILLVYLGGIISCFQLLFVFPKISREYARSLPKFVKASIWVILLSLFVSTLLSTSISTAILGVFGFWENNLLIYLCFTLIAISWYVFFHLLSSLNLHNTVFITLMSFILLMTIMFSVGEYYLWKPSANYLSYSVTRINLGFQNPLFAGYFIGMLWGYQFTQTLTALVNKERSNKNLLSVVVNLLLFFGVSFSLLVTFTRSAWIGSILVALIVSVLLFLKSNERFRLSISLLILLIPVSLLTYSFRHNIQKRNIDLYADSESVVRNLNEMLGYDSKSTRAADDFYKKYSNYTSAQLRFIEWRWGIETWTGSVKNFLIGAGPDNGTFEFSKYRFKELNNIPENFATRPYAIRNLYISTLVEHGLIYTLALFSLLLLCFISWYRSKDFKLETVPAFAIILELYAQGMFYFPTTITKVLALFAICFILAIHTDKTRISLRNTTKSEKLVLTIIAIGIFAWAAILIKVERTVLVYRYNVLIAGDPTFKKNVNFPFNNNILVRYFVAKNSYDSQVLFYLNKLGNSRNIDDLWVAADVYYTLGRDIKSTQLVTDSANALQKAIKESPSQPNLYDNLGLRYLYLGNFTDARKQFNKAIELKEDYWFAYTHLGEVSRQECKPEEAIDWYTKVVDYLPLAKNEIAEARAEIETPRPECKK